MAEILAEARRPSKDLLHTFASCDVRSIVLEEAALLLAGLVAQDPLRERFKLDEARGGGAAHDLAMLDNVCLFYGVAIEDVFDDGTKAALEIVDGDRWLPYEAASWALYYRVANGQGVLSADEIREIVRLSPRGRNPWRA